MGGTTLNQVDTAHYKYLGTMIVSEDGRSDKEIRIVWVRRVNAHTYTPEAKKLQSFIKR